MTPRSITITPALCVRERLTAYAEKHNLSTSEEVLAHLTGRLEVLNLIATELQTVLEGLGRDYVDGFELAVNVLTEHHKAVSEDFLSLWQPMPEKRECDHKWRRYEGIGTVCRDCGTPELKQDDPGHSVRVATPANDSEWCLFEVWEGPGGGRDRVRAISLLDALSRYAVSRGYSRYDDVQELLDTVRVDDDGSEGYEAHAVYTNTTLYARQIR